MKRILVVWENSRSSDKALRKANLLAKHANATVKVISFIGTTTDASTDEQKITALSEQLENSIDHVFEPGIEVSCKLVDCVADKPIVVIITNISRAITRTTPFSRLLE